MAKTSLPPGFRFHPTDIELTVYYLKRKLMGKQFRCDAISEIDLYKFAPWDLPDKSCLQSKDLEWYFFCPRDRKYSSGSRTNRSTEVGYWKATGKDRPVIYNSRIVGMKRTLVFHVGKPPRGDRTDWVMYEYRLEDKELSASGVQLDAYVLCKIFQKSGPGPKIGEQYGAPFNEEDWNDDANAGLAPSPPFVPPCPPESSNDMLNSAGQRLVATDDGEVSVGTLSEPVGERLINDTHREITSASDIPFDGISIQQLTELLTYSSTHLLNTSVQDGLLLPDLTAQYENDNEVSADDTEAIYNQLDDIACQAVKDHIYNPGNTHGEQALQPMLSALENEQYLELNDLSFSPVDDSYGLLLPNDLSALYPLELQPRFQREYPNNIAGTANTTTSIVGSPAPAMPNVDDHVT